MTSLADRLQAALGEGYAIERELGGGGMSRVFVAAEVELGRRVVVKVLPPEMAAGVNAERFRREIQLAASLQHPHIVPLLRAGRADDLVWYTMPLVEGESLRARLARQGELPIPEAVRIMRDVAAALAYAHGHGVVHRDIKPDNVLLSQGFAVVTDFGVAKAVSEATGESSLTSLGIALGTPAYMAPEQASADPHTDHRADIYALGVLGYEMLAGRPPFTAPSPQMVLAAHVTQAPAPITEHRTVVPPALAAIVMRCLEKKPADRWQSAADLYQQLDAMATPSGGMAPTAALPASAPAVTGAAPGRHRRVLAPALAAVALLVVLAAAAVVVPRLGGGRAEASGSRPMLVVLPFQNLGNPDDQYFADGITEEITSRLAALGGLGVISRTSAMQYRGTNKPLRQIGEELNVGYVLEGTIRWEKRTDGSNRVRVSPQLIKVADDTHLWAQTYDAELKEVFAVQSDIAGQVAQALNVALLTTAASAAERPPTTDVEAYQHYLQGNEYYQRGYGERDISAAIDLYERAVALDPRFAHAHARLAIAHAQMFWFYFDRTPERIQRARQAASRALALNAELPLAHTAQGFVHYWGARDYASALNSFGVARRAEPNNGELISAVAFVLRRQGKWREAAQRLEEAAALDPRSTVIMLGAGETYYALREFDTAEEWFRRALRITPDAPTGVHYLAWTVATRTERLEAGEAIIRDAMRRSGEDRYVTEIVSLGRLNASPLGGAEYQRAVTALRAREGMNPIFFYAAKAEAFETLGDPNRARAHYDSARLVLERSVRERPDDAGFRAFLGWAYAGLGRGEDAEREGRRATELLPVDRDALDGASYLEILAQIYARSGQHDAAVATLERLLSIPSQISVQMLRTEPRWQPLRSHPRFQQLIARR